MNDYGGHFHQIERERVFKACHYGESAHVCTSSRCLSVALARRAKQPACHACYSYLLIARPAINEVR